MVTDQELVCCLESLLRQVAPGTTASLSGIVRHLEARLGLNLSHKAAFIRHHIDLLLSPPLPPPKDHFALNPQFYHHLHHLPHHHDFAFRYPAPQMPVTIEAHQHQHKVDQFEDEQKQPQLVPVMPAPKEGASAGVKRRGRPGGLNKVCRVSPELQAIVGEPTMARTQIVKHLWAYIRKNNLQDPKNKRKIICNDELRLVFETDCTDMFKMNKLLCKHIITLDSTKDTGPNSKKLKVTAEVISATEHDPGQNPVAISDALALFFGTGERDMIQSEASRRVWDYIKANQLEDPMNPMVVLCDSKLQQLFGCESLSSLGIQELLMRHLFKQS